MRRGLAPSRARATAEIAAGRVLVSGTVADKPSRLVAPGEPVLVQGPPAPFVSRAGTKLDAALDRFGIDVTGLLVLDAGASTGGFTDCLLQRGARRVVAVDVGHGQLHERLRADPRVEVHERCNVRELPPGVPPEPVDLVTADLSFISLRTVIDPLLAAATAGAELVLLVKPQFEAGRREAARGRGIITDPVVWARVLAEVCDALVARGAAIMGVMCSPLRGSEGNAEFLLHVRAPNGAAGDQSRRPVAELIAGAVAEADGGGGG